MNENRCENCKYFFDSIRYASPDDGLCRIILPPWVPEPVPLSRLIDKNYVCDLHKPKEVKP